MEESVLRVRVGAAQAHYGGDLWMGGRLSCSSSAMRQPNY